jgi:hypothetical protein
MPIYGEDKTYIKAAQNDKFYVSGFARLAPFLISKGRSIISKIIEPYIKTVIRCHTDGFICSKEPTNIITGDKLGDLVYEGYNENYMIIKGNSYDKNFVI